MVYLFSLWVSPPLFSLFRCFTSKDFAIKDENRYLKKQPKTHMIYRQKLSTRTILKWAYKGFSPGGGVLAVPCSLREWRVERK